MGDINTFALQKAEAAGARLWALGSAPFPLVGGAILQSAIEREVTDTAIAFAIHLRRVLDNKADGAEFQLDEPFRLWNPAKGLTKVPISGMPSTASCMQQNSRLVSSGSRKVQQRS